MAVEAAVVVFGLFEGVVDGDAFLRRWLTKVCLDFRPHVVDGYYSADCLFYKKVTVRWLGNTVQTYASRWGFKRDRWDHDNIQVISREDYLKGPTPKISSTVAKLLKKTYATAVDWVWGMELDKAWRAQNPARPLIVKCRPWKRQRSA